MPTLAETILEKLPGLCFVHDEAHRMVLWNRNAEVVTGRSAEAMLGADAIGFVVEGDRTRAVANARAALADGAADCEIGVIAADGTIRTFAFSTYRIEHEGRPHVLGIGVDVTERRRAEDALRLSEARFRHAFEASSDGVAWLALDGRFMKVNPAYERLMGYSAAELAGMTFFDITMPQDLKETAGLKERLDSGELSHLVIEKRYRRKSGQVVWARVAVGLVRDEAGRPLHYSTQVQDISERRHAEEQRDAAEAKLRRALRQTIEAMADTAEKYDPYTDGHERRVAALSREIGRELGLDEARLEGIYMAAMIHDIGKVSIPTGILSKPGRLSPEEFALVKTHVKTGHCIVKKIDLPWPVADVILQHHERLDGSGYPNGIAGDQICLEARIVAVADVVEAMSSHRPYRPSRGCEAALAEIQAHRGTRYDAAVVDACVGVVRTGRFCVEQGAAAA